MTRILSVWSQAWPISVWRRKNRSGSAPDSLPPRGGKGGDGGECSELTSTRGLARSPTALTAKLSGHTPTQPSPLEGEGFALVISDRGVRRLYAVDEQARALGLYPGQKAADALALAPELETADADPEGDLEALNALADWCVRYSPAVAPDAPDGLLMDVTGVTHLWGGEAAMLDDLTARLAANDIPARAAIADTAGAAWALARFGPPPLGEGDHEVVEGASSAE
ncbi:MAG: Y-family DNA polymerase, partial [Ignavibacteriales bacterium]